MEKCKGMSRLSVRDLIQRDGKPVYLKDIDTWMLVCVVYGRAYLRAGDGSIRSPEDHTILAFEGVA